MSVTIRQAEEDDRDRIVLFNQALARETEGEFSIAPRSRRALRGCCRIRRGVDTSSQRTRVKS